jgi:hypothetical protein
MITFACMKNRKILALAPVLLFAACARAVKETPLTQPHQAVQGAVPMTPMLRRTYTAGEVFKYKLELNYSEAGTESRSVSKAAAVVKKRGDGVFYELWQWTGAQKNGADVELPPESLEFRQLLSLDPGFKLAIPDLSRIVPLIEPVVDTLTFYADLQLAVQKGLLLKPGEHIFIEHGLPNSWEGGPTLLGRDCIDFDLTVTTVAPGENTATLKALHVPPAQGCGVPPAAWLGKPVGDTPNNWYQVRKEGKYAYVVGAAKETFDDEIIISLSDGHIVSASQLNQVAGEKRTCADELLTKCGAPARFSIVRALHLSQEAE